MVDREVVNKRIHELEELLLILRASEKLDMGIFLEDKKECLATLYALQLSIQQVLDIGSHILADKGIKNIDEYKQIIIKLGQENILPMDFSNKIAPIAGLRNILVHNYVEIDLKLIYQFLKTHLNDFDTYISHIKKYLIKKS